MSTRMEFKDGKDMANFMQSLRAEKPNTKAEPPVAKPQPTQLNNEEAAYEDDCLAERFIFSAEIHRKDFAYDPVEQTYRVEGRKLHEGQMTAFAVNQGVFLMNFDPAGSLYNKHLAQSDRSAITPYHISSPHPKLDPLYRQFYETAKRRNYPCFVVWCHEGKLVVPCYSFIDHDRGYEECIACLFNATPCEYWHRHMLCAVEVQVGDFCDRLFIAYHRGAEINWGKFIAARSEYILAQAEEDYPLLSSESLSYVTYPSYITIPPATKK